MKKRIGVFITLLLVFIAPFAAQADYTINYGNTGNGSLNSTNWNDYWYFNGSSGDKIEITMNVTSGDLDPWLTLWKIDSSGNWTYLVVDDNSGGGKNAKISHTLPSSGKYAIESTRYQDKNGTTSGSYSVTLTLLSGSSSTGSTGGSSSGYFGQPYDNWDEVAPGCPSGWRCLDNVATRWSSLNTLTYCIASSSGQTENVGGYNINIKSDFSFRQDLLATINYWDNLLNSFSMTEVTCSSNPSFKFGLIDKNDLATVTGKTTTIGVSYPPNPIPGVIYIRSDRAAGDSRQLTLAHELGHGLGLGHSRTPDSLMYPNHPSIATTLAAITLGSDSADQLVTAYPNNATVVMSNNGYNSDAFEAVNGVPATIQVPYPSGATRVIALCMIQGYWAKGSNYGDDADMGWDCSFNFDANDRVVNFTLTPLYSSDGKIGAKALVINLDAYTLNSLYFFQAYGENASPICIGGADYTDYTTTTPRYNVTTPYLNYPAGSIPIVAITRYDTWSVDEPDDDMSFGVYLNGNTFSAQAWDGCGEVDGWVAVISPSNANNYKVENCWLSAGDYYPYNQTSVITLPSTNPSCNITLENSWNQDVFSSLVIYNAHTDDHFSASDWVNDNGNTLNNQLWAAYGDDLSQVWFEVISMKSK